MIVYLWSWFVGGRRLENWERRCLCGSNPETESERWRDIFWARAEEGQFWMQMLQKRRWVLKMAKRAGTYGIGIWYDTWRWEKSGWVAAVEWESRREEEESINVTSIFDSGIWTLALLRPVRQLTLHNVIFFSSSPPHFSFSIKTFTENGWAGLGYTFDYPGPSFQK